MTRTCDLRFRKPSLYPAELRDRIEIIRLFLAPAIFGSFLARGQARHYGHNEHILDSSYCTVKLAISGSSPCAFECSSILGVSDAVNIEEGSGPQNQSQPSYH